MRLRSASAVVVTGKLPVFKNFWIDFALWMAERRGRQAVVKLAASEWWQDVSEALEDGVALHVVRARRESLR